MPNNTTDPPNEEIPTTNAGEPTPQATLAEQAVAMLADHLDITADDITVVSWEEVTWPDGSIGCPQPGMRYTQAIVNGSKVVLEVDGVEYAYHQGGGRDLFLCEQAGVEKSPPPTIDL